MRDVLTYTSYRELIKDYYDAKKSENPSFSYQVFAQRSGFKAKTYLLDIISGKRPLSKKSLLNVATAMGLKKRETDYFETLVNFNNSKSSKEKEYYFERLKSLAGRTGAQKITSNQYDYFSQWYHVAIRELVTMKGFKGNYKTLAKKLNPRITPKQAKDSVQLLLRLGMIQKMASGTFKQKDPQISTGDELYSLAVLKHQQETLKLANEALERIPVENRDISTVTAGISYKCFGVVKQEIQLFRKRLLSIIEEDQGVDVVYQINFQLFPLTRPEENR